MCDLTQRPSHNSRRGSPAATTEGSDIGKHALRLAIQIQRQQPRGTPGWEICQFLGRVVASCVFYDCVRNRRGKIRDVFSEYYQQPLEWMLRMFCDYHWPCSFADCSNRFCAGTKLSHGREHRNAVGKAIGLGEYESAFFSEAYQSEWLSFLKTEINACEDEYREALNEEPPNVSGRRIASKLHLEQMNDYFTDLGSATLFVSHASCFGCLIDIPHHPLPCGHVLCNNCVNDHRNRTYGKIELDSCPLHVHTRFDPPWKISRKYNHAGVRILCLDGGGVRGIVELEVLRAIEKTLGGDIPIQEFFDLIVGTSAGGINALALGVKQWPVAYCIKKFEKFCDQAFTEREFGGVWGLEKAALVNHGSKYKTKPLHNVLQETLGRRILFGATDSLNTFRIKVAVTATSGDGKEAMVLANYNRSHGPGDSQVFVRPEDPTEELEVWEAAAATSAAPLYFKPYTHLKTGTSYIDGGLYHNNPVHVANRERKLLWPETADKHPDLLLSVGTGLEPAEVEEGTDRRHSPDSKNKVRPKIPHRRSSGIRKTFGALYQRFDNILDAENTWTDFEADIANLENNFPSPYVRLNVDLRRKLPAFDAKDKFQELRQDVKQRLQEPDVVKMINDVACSLVASSFYFKCARVHSERDGKFSCTGYICCKFEEGSSRLKTLGEFLRKYSTSYSTPYFITEEASRCVPDGGVKVELTDKILSRMTTYGMLRIPPVKFGVSNPIASITMALVLPGRYEGEKIQSHLLSGFPRQLVQEIPCRTTTPNHDEKSTSAPGNAHTRSISGHVERRQVQATTNRTAPLPSRPSTEYRPQASPPFCSTPYQYAVNSRTDSAIDIPRNTRSSSPPAPHSHNAQITRPRNTSMYQAFSYGPSPAENTVPVYLVERAARQIRQDNERCSRRDPGDEDRSRTKKLMKKGTRQ